MHGAVASPFDALNGLRGIRTLAVRVRQQSATAQRLAEFLEDHDGRGSGVVPRARLAPAARPGQAPDEHAAATVLTFELAGGLEAGRRFVEACRVAQLAPSLGGPETLVTHPATMTAATLTPEERAAMGIGDGHDPRLGRARAPRRPRGRLHQRPRMKAVVADVFTDRAFEGNQLAVFTEGASVPEELLQPLAREIGFSETVFVYEDDRIRIFTPATEIPFAGHPVLGTAFVLATTRGVDRVVLGTGAGPVPVEFDGNGRGRMTQLVPTIDALPADQAGAIRAALGLAGSDLPMEVYDNGLRHAYVVLEVEDDVAALTPDFGALADVAGGMGTNCIAGSGTAWKTRMFIPGGGINEDPATGSAAGPLAVHVARHGLAPWGEEITVPPRRGAAAAVGALRNCVRLGGHRRTRRGGGRHCDRGGVAL